MLDQIFETEGEWVKANRGLFFSSWGISAIAGISGYLDIILVTDSLLIMGLMISNLLLLNYQYTDPGGDGEDDGEAGEVKQDANLTEVTGSDVPEPDSDE
jgi:hypothetical protein